MKILLLIIKKPSLECRKLLSTSARDPEAAASVVASVVDAQVIVENCGETTEMRKNRGISGGNYRLSTESTEPSVLSLWLSAPR